MEEPADSPEERVADWLDGVKARAARKRADAYRSERIREEVDMLHVATLRVELERTQLAERRGEGIDREWFDALKAKWDEKFKLPRGYRVARPWAGTTPVLEKRLENFEPALQLVFEHVSYIFGVEIESLSSETTIGSNSDLDGDKGFAELELASVILDELEAMCTPEGSGLELLQWDRLSTVPATPSGQSAEEAIRAQIAWMALNYPDRFTGEETDTNKGMALRALMRTTWPSGHPLWPAPPPTSEEEDARAQAYWGEIDETVLEGAASRREIAGMYGNAVPDRDDFDRVMSRHPSGRDRTLGDWAGLVWGVFVELELVQQVTGPEGRGIHFSESDLGALRAGSDFKKMVQAKRRSDD